MPAVDQTPTFKLNLPTFDLRVWHTYVNENFSVIDSVLQHYLNIEGLVGVWRNATQYHAGERAVDPEQGAIYECMLDNVSAAAPTTFAQDRVSNPAYWGGFTVQEEFKGTWQNNTPYTVQDFVVSGNIYAVCLTSHTSVKAPGVFGDDGVYWIYLINLSGNVLPSIVGHGSSYIRARPDETAVEYRTIAQMRTDLGIQPGGTFQSINIDNANGTTRSVNGLTSGIMRWTMNMGNAGAESGSNTGSDFNLQRYNDGGGLIDAPLTVVRANGQFRVNCQGLGRSNLPHVDGAAGTNRGWLGSTVGSDRWHLVLGDTTAESGANAGSNFSIIRFDDSGNVIDNPLNIIRSTGQFRINCQGVGRAGLPHVDGVAAVNRGWLGSTSGSDRWHLILGTSSVESGGNAGSDFNINRFDDSGTLIDTPLTITRSNGRVTLNVVAGASNPRIDGAAATQRGIVGSTNGVDRWSMFLANLNTESGSNAGSDLTINRYADNGVIIDSPLTITRSTGQVTINVPAGTTRANSTHLNTAAGGTLRAIVGSTNNLDRWSLHMGDSTAEGGSNAGSNFSINTFTDAGTVLATPIAIVRSTGVTSFSVAIVNGPSDRTLKENIKPLKDALDKVMKLQGVSFNFIKDKAKHQIGLIAQDVRDVVPEVIQDFIMPDEEPKLAVDYTRLVPVLIEAIKELTARVKHLEARR